VKNQSKANMLWITLDETDTYTMKFVKYTPGRLNKKTFEWVDDKMEEIKTIDFIYAEELQAHFTAITGLDTHL
jgi:hypothetical protein